MRNQRARVDAVAAVAAVLLWIVTATAFNGIGYAQSNAGGDTPVGTWFVSAGVPVIKSAFYTYHADGTVAGVVSPARGGPLMGAEGADHGTWQRRGQVFESSVFRFNHDPATGGAFMIARIRSVFSLDAGFDRGSGQFFITVWMCPTPVSCPDPNVAAPTIPEFAIPGNVLTMTRMRVR